MKASMRKALLFNVRLTVNEGAALRRLAREADQTVSGYIRSKLFVAPGIEERITALEEAVKRMTGQRRVA